MKLYILKQLAIKRKQLAIKRKQLAIKRKQLAIKRNPLVIKRKQLAIKRKKFAIKRKQLYINRKQNSVFINTNNHTIENCYTHGSEHIPIFIIVHDQFEILKQSVNSYETSIKNTPYKIIFHDVASTYYETINYLAEKELQGYTVYRTKVNNHHSVLNSIKHYLNLHPECKYCVMTDPDIKLHNINGDILKVYIHALHALKKISVGPMLEINDIPNYYPQKQTVLKSHTSQFWSKLRKTMSFNKNNYKYIDCDIDTTFQLFFAKNIPKTFPHGNCARFLAPYSAKHLDWYINPNNLTPCQTYYLHNTSGISHWNTNIRGNIMTKNYIARCKYIYYDICKCKGRNFGDEITAYIYKKITNQTPILDINGGKKHDKVIFGSGSILNSCKANSIIWGTGLMMNNQTIIKPAKILSVRGPLTRNRILKQNIPCPEIYGDIGLILPYFYRPIVIKQYEIGILPHYVDVLKCTELFKNCQQSIKIIDVTNPIEQVIHDILTCKMTMSSSLHGIIVSHAYNIRCMWIKISNLIEGGCFEFRDYYGSVNVSNYDTQIPYELKTILTVEEMQELINNYINPNFPIKTKHILKLCPF